MAKQRVCNLIRLNSGKTFEEMLAGSTPILALAPMQDVTDLPFWRLMTEYGGRTFISPNISVYIRPSCLDWHILESITENPTGRPVIAQMIGNDIPSLESARRGSCNNMPSRRFDLNLGCPAPVVYRKCAGGGLLREPQRVDCHSWRVCVTPGKHQIHREDADWLRLLRRLH